MVLSKDVRKQIVAFQLNRCDISIQCFINYGIFEKGFSKPISVKIGRTPLLKKTRKTLRRHGWKVVKEEHEPSGNYYIELSAI